MSHWRELGEVPDSEDEGAGFDSEECSTDSPLPVTDAATVEGEADIWDFLDPQEDQRRRPASPETRLPAPPPVFDSSPLSSALGEPDLPPVSSLLLNRDSVENPPSLELGRTSQPALQPRSGSHGSPRGNRIDSSVSIQASQNQESARGESIHEARHAAVRCERSLRPRKPIQEHPYLLENARYSTILKKHGVKPLRAAMELAASRPEHALIDGEFEDTSQDSVQRAQSSEGQRNSLESSLGALGEFDFPSSSPPKTPSLVEHAQNSTPVSSQGETDTTSVPDQDLPALEELLSRPPRLVSKHGASKRDATQQPSTVQKRRRLNVVHSDPVDLEATPSTRPNLPLIPPVMMDHSLLFERSPSPTLHPLEKVTAISSDDGGERERASEERASELDKTQDMSSLESSSESDTNLMDTLGHRMRGVLPASWLRLDQQSGRDKAQRGAKRQRRCQFPERENQRGIAQKRQALPGATVSPLLFDESSDSDVPGRSKKTNVLFHSQTRLTLDPAPRIDRMEPTISDDNESIGEDDQIDFMLPGRPAKSRQLKLHDSTRGSRKRPSAIKDSVGTRKRKRPKQARIARQLQIPYGLSLSGAHSPTRRAGNDKWKGLKTSRTKSKSSRMPPPPRLSILDTIEPGAPHFLKIAARAAKRRHGKGRSSPRKKSIQLATRQDHVDAVSVLDRWRAGWIPQRPSVTAASTVTQKPHSALPLAEGSGNISTPRPSQKPLQTKTRRLVKHVTNGGTVSYRKPGGFSKSISEQGLADECVLQPRLGSTRPAQLEQEQGGQMNSATFHARKMILDRLYRDRHLKMPRMAFAAGSVEEVDTSFRAANPCNETFPKQPSRKPRVRKGTRPCRVDLEAPRYSHANDPLPPQYSSARELIRADGLEGKVLGLGPYGTNYSHHFEVFPLDARVYFHESTLIGSGVVESCSGDGFCERILDDRPRASFNLGDQPLKWGLFDAQVSSELGVVLDFIAEHIATESAGESYPSDSSTSVAAAMFILTYFKDSMRLREDEQAKSFVARVHECLHSFNERVRFQVQRIIQGPETKRDVALNIYDRLLLGCLVVLKICRVRPLLTVELFQIEDCLKSLASTLLSILSGLGATQVRKSYEDLDMARYRERGLRGDTPVIHSWVVVMKTLEIAQIPRASFWELAQATIAPPQVLSSLDARVFERSWEAMFSLLPLTEFNRQGVIVAGRRHDPASDGWIIPQKLLKRVFHLYKENSRQSPSFNNYCRALVGRCHYLVQQWGWRRCITVIGVIFDFFGSQNLAHLRNEEAYESPRFLEELVRRPTLDIEQGDLCFHVFLKLVALSIQKLKGIGAVKDVRNMVARTIPNHNRQHLKERDVLARELAALRNHHDLLSTLFWASPPELRPPANLIERLVAPATSHKEACLINVRCWNQLARFIVTSGEASQSFKPLIQWRNAFFQQVLRQFDSVPSDVQQQVLSLAKDVSKSISDEVIHATISMNRAAVMDVLYACMTASLDVMKHTPDLEAATFALNTIQLQSIFKHFVVAPPALDWGVLRAALGTMDLFLSRIDEFKEAEESQQSESQILNSAQADDALLLVDQDILPGFFSMARCVLSCPRNRTVSAVANLDRASCLEQIVTLSARMGARFTSAGVMRLSDMFKVGKYGLFDGPPHKLGLDQRRSLVLFMSTLLKCGFDDFDDGDFSLSELWVLSLVKPREYLGYEMQLAQELHRRGKDLVKGLVPKTIEGLVVQADYSTNRELFEFAISAMRQWIREAGPSLHKVLVAESSRTLRLVMEQIKGDLATMSREACGHGSYVTFVQGIMSLIKTYGSDFCAVDNFFLQISKEYSPSVQDPNLQVAGLISYGLRLREGDGRSSQQLFFLLFNNIKFAIIKDKMREEVVMLRKGMRNPGIVDFVLGKMLPAIVRACFRSSAALPLLDIYAEALRLVFRKKTVSHELRENDLPLVEVLVRAAVDGLHHMSRSSAVLCGRQLHVVRQTMATLNLLWPCMYAVFASGVESPAWTALFKTLGHVREFVSTAETYLEHLLQTEGRAVEPAKLCAGLGDGPLEGFQFDAEVRSFTGNIVQDIEKSWVVTTQSISVQTPGINRRGAASMQGVEIPTWDTKDMMEDLDGRLREWRWWWQRMYAGECVVEQLESVIF